MECSARAGDFYSRCEMRMDHQCGQFVGNFKVHGIPNPVVSEKSLSLILNGSNMRPCVRGE